jgi:hypothetical protein
MYGSSKYRSWLRHPGFNKKDSKAPDYSQMAAASVESAKIMGDLGNAQLDFAKQQYQDTKPMMDRLAQQQIDIADQSAAQGKDYNDYLKTFRPTEQAMMAEAMKDNSGKIEEYNAANTADASTATMDDASLYAQRKGEVDPLVDQAVADTQGGYTRSVNQAIRQGMRYGSGMSGITANVGGVGLAQASQIASAANSARTYGVQSLRDRAVQRIGLRQNNMSQANAQDAIGWAKKLDAAGLVKGLPGASSGAYGIAVSAGNSAGQNAMAPGAQLQNGMAAGASTIGQGRSLYQSGLGSILNSQSTIAANQGDTAGSLIGAAGGVAAAFI